MYLFKSFKEMMIHSGVLFVVLTSGGCSADPPAAAAESAADRAGPEEDLPRGHPEEKQQTTHAAAVHHSCGYLHPTHDQLKPNLHLQICSFCFSGAQYAQYSHRHPTLEGKAEEREDQSSRPGCSAAGFRVGQG